MGVEDILLAVLAVAFALSGVTKLLDVADARQRVAAVGVPVAVAPAIGAVELAVAVAVAGAALGTAAALLAVAVMCGALASHVRHGDRVALMVPALAYLTLAVATLVATLA